MGERLAGKLLGIWNLYCTKKQRSSFSGQVEKELSGLNPGSNVKKLVQQFYVNKIMLCLLIAAIGGALLFLYIISSLTDSTIEAGGKLKRDVPGGMEKTVVLDAQVGEVRIRDISISVEEKQYTTEEKEEWLNKACLELPMDVLGKNTDLSHVDKPLSLISSWEQAPISIFWKSSDREILAEDGSLCTDGIGEEGRLVTLTAELVFDDLIKTCELSVKVFPPILSREEALREKLFSLVDVNQENTKTDLFLELPRQVSGDDILWKEPIAELLPVLLLLLAISVMGVFIGKDRELHQEYEKRNHQLLLEYPELVSKLQLLLCSGMSVRSALAKISRDYQTRRKKGGKRQYVCEELLLAVRKMENGMPETEALKLFGERCNLFCYKKLVSLITQNMKKGSDGLREAMLSESRNAFEERKQTARRLGEEAGTKLLLPMMMMMGIVLVLIIIPAYFSFGGIN